MVNGNRAGNIWKLISDLLVGTTLAQSGCSRHGAMNNREREVRNKGLFSDGFKELKKVSEPIYKAPKSIQETIESMAAAENGIFEVAKNKYSKCYRFQDINNTATNEDGQIDIFERYCKFLNSLDCNFKITVNNKNKNMEDRRSLVLLQYMNDKYDHFHRIYNNIIEEKILLRADRVLSRSVI